MAVQRLEIWLNNKWVQRSLRLMLATLITGLLTPFKLDVLESAAYDWRMQLAPSPKRSDHIVLLSIERDTLKKLQREPEAMDWAVALQKLAQAGPAQVVSLINPAQLQGSYEDLAALAEVAERLPFRFGEDEVPKPGLNKMDRLAPPFQRLSVEPAPHTSDKDGVSRRTVLTYDGQFTMHPLLAQAYSGLREADQYNGVFKKGDSGQLLISYHPRGSYPVIRFIDAIERGVDPALVRGKIVLIGRDTAEVASDYVTTPLNKDLLGLSRLEMHANILDTLIFNQAPYVEPDWLKVLFTFLISLLTINVVLSVRPGQGLVILCTSMAVYLGISLLLFTALRLVIPVAHPLVAVFICYYFMIPYRLIVENRRSWEYYQKNRLLTQVEELKSNFMRMMSHDLKTPLARIQGMAELIRKEPGSLTENQRLALETIAESSEELTDFIGSILSLSRIEAKELKLDLRSRDPNQLVREAIRRTDYLAKRKDIEVVTELDPLFSIKVDENLLKTVLNNLLENAIKYSPEHTRILITTEEIDNQVVIQVADQGRGIPAEDLPHVFDRFYRARNSRANTPGNGLGLYLAKYFVELHNGRIEVESLLDKGSTFTVRLPMDLNREMEPADHSESQGGLYV